MFVSSKALETTSPVPFHSGEEAWLWTMAAVLARGDGAGIAWRPAGLARPCEPDDVVKCLDGLYRRGAVGLLHARILRVWGERQAVPQAHLPGQADDACLWRQAIAPLEWALRGRGIVR